MKRLRIVNEEHGYRTRVYTEDGEELEGVQEVRFVHRAGEFAQAEIVLGLQDVEVVAEFLQNQDRFERLYQVLGEILEKKKGET